MSRANSMLIAFAILYGCEGEPPPPPPAAPVEARVPEPPPPAPDPPEVEPDDIRGIADDMYELGRDSVLIEQRTAEAKQELDDMKKVVYLIACVERDTGGAVNRDKELERLARGRPSRAFRKCKKEILGMTQEEIDAAVWDEENNRPKDVIGKL